MLLAPPLDFAGRADLAAASSAGGPGLENQDNFLLIDGAGRAASLRAEQLNQSQVADWPAGHLRLAILDGMGGHGHGREAAEAVVDGLLDMPACANLPTLCAWLDALHKRLQTHFAALDAAESGAANSIARRPGTTLTLIEWPPGEAPMLYHVGDSRLYEIGADAIKTLTIDHVPATVLALAGVLDEAAWRRQVQGEHRPHIAQAFLLGNAFADPTRLADALFPLTAERLPPYLAAWPDRRVLQLRSDAHYLLATDGFWSCDQPAPWIASWPALLDGAASAADSVARLFAAVDTLPEQQRHRDNLTAIVFRPSAPGLSGGVIDA